MVVDTSALVAILLGEPERERFVEAILSARVRVASAATLLETTMVVLSRRGEPAVAALQAFIDTANIETAAFTEEQLALAVEAFRRFGKGRHPAGLNFGDCFSYALARASGDALLFKGRDFAETDVLSAGVSQI